MNTRNVVFPTRARGYVLVLTLWILAAISIGAGYFAFQTSTGVEAARAWRQRADALQAVSEARSEMLYRLATTPLSVYGLGVDNEAVRMDGRLYRAEEGALLQVQDDGGLISLGTIDRLRLGNLLSVYGVETAERERMLDALQDYMEKGDTHRLNAPDKKDYGDLGLPPAREAPLLTPQELRRVAVWAKHPELFDAKHPITDMLSTGLSRPMNPNTAPVEVLRAAMGINAQQAASVVSVRKQAPILDGQTLAAAASVPLGLQALMVFGRPAVAMSLTFQAEGQRWRLRNHITLTPNELAGPWLVDYTSELPADPDPLPIDVPRLPPRQLHFVQPATPFGAGLFR